MALGSYIRKVANMSKDNIVDVTDVIGNNRAKEVYEQRLRGNTKHSERKIAQIISYEEFVKYRDWKELDRLLTYWEKNLGKD
jgi:hypothetical protein